MTARRKHSNEVLSDTKAFLKTSKVCGPEPGPTDARFCPGCHSNLNAAKQPRDLPFHKAVLHGRKGQIAEIVR